MMCWGGSITWAYATISKRGGDRNLAGFIRRGREPKSAVTATSLLSEPTAARPWVALIAEVRETIND
jgi:hypothetical protein